ncbi:MAG: hypothetical protein IKM31_05625 [Oscillospiraceae bacterium]|nr:hypothetical protein [Oscillospiraceae bacterium]
MGKYETFREQYPEFIYESYDIEEQDGKVLLTYHFSVPGLRDFAPRWTLPMPEAPVLKPSDPVFRNLAFSLGLVELISYWKIACPPVVRVKCGSLDEEQILWWKQQYLLGLGEFFYKNGISVTLDDFMTIRSEGEPIPAVPAAGREELPLHGCMIPVGGGKDSIVSMELLKEAAGESFADENCCYIMNPRGATVDSARIAGLGDRIVGVGRTLDKNMLELNKLGFLNGHTPFSALVAFSAVLMAAVYGKKYVVLSNESSANESTVAGSDVNHQYSKSFRFEEDFNGYEKKFIGSGVHYFSLLRPWSEFQIAAYFARLGKYHADFRSCNVGSKTNIWCGNCPKCLFVWVILSPFLSTAQLEAIFGSNLAEKEELWETLRQLCGMTPEKPFECVGSRDEICFALKMAIARMEKEKKPLPLLYQKFIETDLYKEYQEKENPYFDYFNGEHLLPDEFLKIVRAAAASLKEKEGSL